MMAFATVSECVINASTVSMFLMRTHLALLTALFDESAVKRLAQVVLVLLSGVIADGFFYSAHAQCAPSDEIYIDPRLVPRPNIPRGPIGRLMLGQPDSVKAEIRQRFLKQGQPIVVPYGTGKVLVNPANPCIQQYIP